MKKRMLVDSRLTYPATAAGKVIDTFLSLPGDLRPTHHRFAENQPRKEIGNPVAFRNGKVGKSSGFLLHAGRITYAPDLFDRVPVECNCYDIPPSLAREFLTNMAAARPIFGFCCSEDEKNHRNWLKVSAASGTIEGYFGRNTEKYVPGLYWLTLISEQLAKKHNVSLEAVKDIALEHVELGDGIHFFRFYDKPEDWKLTAKVDKFCALTPGFFDLQRVRSQLKPNAGFRERHEELRPWD
jgi:hypothetical protein